MEGGAGFKTADLRSLKSLPRRMSLGHHVYLNLKRAIVKGELAPGSRVVESRVADALGSSRTPVREAIHKLEREGFLHQSSAGGFFVSGLTRADIEETFGIRSALESHAAMLAAVKHDDGELDPLQEKIHEYQACLDVGRMGSLPEINTDFHDLLYGLSRSPRLIKMINDLRDLIYRFRRVILKNREMAAQSNVDHRLMLEHMRNRDAAGVERLVREHIERGRDAALREFEADLIP